MKVKYLDQNISDVISKNQNSFEVFQEHISPNRKPKALLHITPFSLIEYSGLKPKNIVKTIYKIRREDKFDQDFMDKVFEFYDKDIDQNIHHLFLEKLEEKKRYIKTNFGEWLINQYIEYVKDPNRNFRREIVGAIALDRFATLDFSIMNTKKERLYLTLVENIPEMILKRPYLNFSRLIQKSIKLLSESLDKEKAQALKDFDTKYKADGDLIDTEIPHLAVFGNNNREAIEIYTSDDHELIYCRSFCYFQMLVALTNKKNKSLRDMKVDSTIFCIDKESFIRGEFKVNKEIKMRDIYKESEQSELW